ncbi:unnamed protein product [Vicia faba]|uniref:Uncharacterized protein n=1 Tax=Vicia faba TaxID=3906 RepID=A0AAV0YQ28_VICFA|nr:unnamed protein product [Vicia faba]
MGFVLSGLWSVRSNGSRAFGRHETVGPGSFVSTKQLPLRLAEHEKYDGGESLVERLMPPPVLFEEEMKVSRQRKEHASRFVKTYQESTDYDPNDGEISLHMDVMGDMMSCSGSYPSTIIGLTY